jgi:hypothetical protein
MDEYDPLIQPLGAVPTGRKLEGAPDPRPRATFGVLLDATTQRVRFCRDRYDERNEAEFSFNGTDATETATGRAFTIVTTGDPWVLHDAKAAQVACFVERGGKIVFLRDASDTEPIASVHLGSVGAMG